MNEHEAVVKTITMWEWLRDNPKKGKEDYRDTIPEEEWPVDGINCYLCDVWDKVGWDCWDVDRGMSNIRCPLSTKILSCLEGTYSPFIEWDHQGNHDPKQAQRIVNACKRWLKKATNETG